MSQSVFTETLLIYALYYPDNITNLISSERLLGTSYFLSFYLQCLKDLIDALLLIKHRCSLNVLLPDYDELLLLSLHSKFHCKFKGIC